MTWIGRNNKMATSASAVHFETETEWRREYALDSTTDACGGVRSSDGG